MVGYTHNLKVYAEIENNQTTYIHLVRTKKQKTVAQRNGKYEAKRGEIILLEME